MIIFVAICMTVLLGFAGLATDTGMIWVTRSRLQNSVDAGVLAAAQELPASDTASTNAARDVACEFSTELNPVPDMIGKTGTCSGDADVTFLDEGTAIRVTAYRTVQPMFGRILGFDPVEVSAHATARIGSLGSTCLFPLFLTTAQIDPNNPEFFVPVKFSEANAAVDVGSGAAGVREAMEDLECGGGSPTSFEGGIGSEVDIKSGSATQYKAGWEAIKADATGPGSSCPNPDVSVYTQLNGAGQTEFIPSITTATCPRLIIVPVLPPGTYNGNASGVIQAFVPFYFADICLSTGGCGVPGITGQVEKHKAWGYFVQVDLTSLSFSVYKPELGTKIVSLAD